MLNHSCQSSTDILHKRAQIRVLRKRLNIGVTPQQLREEQPKAGEHYESNGQDRPKYSRQLAPALHRLLDCDLDRQTRPVEQKEPRDLPSGPRPAQIEKYQLVN